MAGGCLVDDFDGDGLLDVFMPTTEPERGALLLHNRGDGTFQDVSEAAGLMTRSCRSTPATPTSTTTARSTS